MSGDVTNQEIHLDEFSDGVYFRITAFQPATRLLSGEEGLERARYHRAISIPDSQRTASWARHGQGCHRHWSAWSR